MEGCICLLVLILFFYGIRFWLHKKNTDLVQSYNDAISFDTVDEIISASLEEYKQTNEIYSFAYDGNDMPLGRAMAFLNFFGRSI